MINNTRRDEDVAAAGRAFEEMRIYAADCLKGRNPEEIAERAQADYRKEEGLLKIKSFGQEVEIKIPVYEIQQHLDQWHHLVLLHYLNMADGAPLTGEWMTLGNMKDGIIRGTKFDKTADEHIGKLVGEQAPGKAKQMCGRLGAEIIQSRADLCAVIPVFPCYPVMLNIWFADDEFGGTARMLVDKAADHYLTVEDAVTVGEMIINRLRKIYAEMGGTL